MKLTALPALALALLVGAAEAPMARSAALPGPSIPRSISAADPAAGPVALQSRGRSRGSTRATGSVSRGSRGGSVSRGSRGGSVSRGNVRSVPQASGSSRSRGSVSRPSTGSSRGSVSRPSTGSSRGSVSRPSTGSSRGSVSRPSTGSSRGSATRPSVGSSRGSSGSPTIVVPPRGSSARTSSPSIPRPSTTRPSTRPSATPAIPSTRPSRPSAGIDRFGGTDARSTQRPTISVPRYDAGSEPTGTATIRPTPSLSTPSYGLDERERERGSAGEPSAPTLSPSDDAGRDDGGQRGAPPRDRVRFPAPYIDDSRRVGSGSSPRGGVRGAPGPGPGSRVDGLGSGIRPAPGTPGARDERDGAGERGAIADRGAATGRGDRPRGPGDRYRGGRRDAGAGADGSAGGGLRRVDGSRSVRSGGAVRGRTGGGAVASPGEGTSKKYGGGSYGGGYAGPSRGSVRHAPAPQIRPSYGDPRYPKGTAGWTPWGYYHHDRFKHRKWSFAFHFGAYCGPSYWYLHWPAYYCWYYPLRFRAWWYPTVYVPYHAGSNIVYVYDHDDDEVVYVYEDAEEAVAFVDGDGEPVGEAAVVTGEEPAPPGETGDPAPTNLAADRYLTLGDEAFRDRRYADAVHFYARAIEYAPESGVLYLVLSDALFATGDYHYAAYAIRKALELDPSLVDSVVDKHGFYDDPSEFDRQLAVLENFVADHPNDADARLVLAVNLLFGGRPADVVDLLQPASLAGDTRRADALVLSRARELQYGPR